MKKLFALLLAALMLLSLAACDKGGEETPPETTTPEEDTSISHTFEKYGKAKVKILGAEVKKDEDDEDYMRVYYEYTNQDETAAGHDPYSTMTLEITQDGEEVDTDEFYTDSADFVEADMFHQTTVQPGIPVRGAFVVRCDPEGGPVEFKMNVMVGSWAYSADDVVWFEFQIDPKNPTPVPAEPFEIQPIAEPTYAKDLPTSGTSTSGSNPFTVSLDGYEVTTYDDMPALRVKLTYTHQHEWDMTPYSALPITAFQDGFSLEQADTWYLEDVTPEDEAYETEISAGTTVKCNAIFLLRGENPVEVVIEQPLDDLRVGMTCTVK